VATSPGILRTVGSLICGHVFLFSVSVGCLFRDSDFFTVAIVSSGLHVWIFHLWGPLPPSLSPSPCRLWNSPLSHPLDACPPHAFVASCSSPLLPLTIMRTGQLCSLSHMSLPSVFHYTNMSSTLYFFFRFVSLCARLASVFAPRR
jgi:hypothetical protein